MKAIYSIIIISICGSSLFISCGRMKNNDIKKSWWKYGSGYHIGDALRFDNNNLKNDTIYSKNKPVAIILTCGKGLFRETAVLEIKDLKKGEIGIYHQKGLH